MTLASSTLRVAACQLRLHIGDTAANSDKGVEAIRAAAQQGARLVVLPELAVSGYAFDSVEEARRLAETLDGPTVRLWSALAAELDVVVVGGLCEDAGAVLRNSSVIIDRTGLRAVYRKVHLWDAEPDFFAPGDEPPPVVETPIGRVSTMVCYDLEFPEWVRRPALAGAEVLAVPTNWPAEPVRATPTPMETVRAQGAASTNRLVVVAADRCGEERGLVWTGGSAVVSAEGHLLAGPPPMPEPCVLVADVDLAATRDKRTSARNDALADRRTDLYGP